MSSIKFNNNPNLLFKDSDGEDADEDDEWNDSEQWKTFVLNLRNVTKAEEFPFVSQLINLKSIAFNQNYIRKENTYEGKRMYTPFAYVLRYGTFALANHLLELCELGSISIDFDCPAVVHDEGRKRKIYYPFVCIGWCFFKTTQKRILLDKIIRLCNKHTLSQQNKNGQTVLGYCCFYQENTMLNHLIYKSGKDGIGFDLTENGDSLSYVYSFALHHNTPEAWTTYQLLRNAIHNVKQYRKQIVKNLHLVLNEQNVPIVLASIIGTFLFDNSYNINDPNPSDSKYQTKWRYPPYTD